MLCVMPEKDSAGFSASPSHTSSTRKGADGIG